MVIDQGGHSTRAAIYDSAGAERAAATVAVATEYPRPGWVEHDPEELLGSVDQSLAVVASSLGAGVRSIRAAALAVQRSSIVCWDRTTGEALSPVLSWQDRRGAAQVERLRPHARLVRATTGLALSAHYGASKLRWCLQHLGPVRGALADRRLACGPLASFLAFRMLEESPCLVDPATAVRTLLWDLDSGDWSQTLLELFQIPRQPLPDSVPSRHDYGHLQLAGTLVPLTVVTGDQAAALFAHGQPRSDRVFINLGTGAFLQRPTADCPIPAPNLLSSIVWHDGTTPLFVLEGAVNGAGSAVSKVGAELGLADPAIAAGAEEWLGRRGRPPLFLNGVSGLGSPYWRADFPSRFVGSGEPWELVVAVLESIVFLIQINLEAMTAAIGPPREILLAGGLSALDSLCRRIADLTGLTVIRSGQAEATTRGAAFLAAGMPGDWPEPAGATRFTPAEDPELEERFHRWRRELESHLG